MKSIVKKIKALLNKTVENGATPMESKSAFEKASSMMLQHYITMNDVENLDIKEEIISKSIPILFRKTKINRLYPVLCNLFECEHHYNRTNITFVGFESDVLIVEYLFVFMNRELLKKLEDFKISEYYISNNAFIHGNTLVSNYIKGYINGLIINLRGLFEDREAKLENLDNSKALILTKKMEIETFMSALNITKVKQRTVINDKATFLMGENDGKNTNLVKAINTKSGNQIMIQS